MMCAKAHELIAEKTDHRFMLVLQKRELCILEISNLRRTWNHSFTGNRR